MKKLDMRLIRMIRHSKGQFISVTMIIAVALCIYVLYSMLSFNIRSGVASYYTLTEMNDITVQLVRIPQGAIHAVEQIEGVKLVQGRVSFDVPLKVSDPNEKITVRLISMPQSGGAVNKPYILGGTDLKMNATHCAVLQQFADGRDIHRGDEMTPIINGTEHRLKVSSIVASSEFVYLMENDQSLMPAPRKFGVLYVDEAFAQSALGYGGSYNELLIKLDKGADLDRVSKLLETHLGKYGVRRITKLPDQISNNILEQKMDGVDKMSKVLPVLFLAVAAIVIVILLSRAVSTDRITIGVLKATGYSNGTILMHYVKYALTIGLTGATVGSILGLFFSVPVIRLFITYFNIPLMNIRIQPEFLLGGVVLTGIFCVGSGLLGARGILKIMPADSMRPEAPKTGNHMALEKWPFIWNLLNTNWRMVIRNIGRTRRRFLFLTLGLALAYAVNTVPLYLSNAVTEMFSEQFGAFQRMDYIIEFSKPLDSRALNQVTQLFHAEKAEPRSESPYELSNGWHRKVVSVIGIPANSTLYQLRDSSNHTLLLKSNGIYLTEALSKDLAAKVGDHIQIKNFIPGRSDVSIKVIGIVKQHLGINGYMELRTMQELLTETNAITSVMVTSHDDVKGKLEDVKNVRSIRSTADLKNSFLEFTNTMALAIQVYMLFGGIMGFAIVYNSSIISIAERSLEFASLRIMGYEKNEVFGIISKENVLMALFALLLGIPLGMGFISAMASSFSSDLVTFPVIFTPDAFVGAAVGTMLFVVIAQWATYRRISGLDFIEAIKNRIS